MLMTASDDLEEPNAGIGVFTPTPLVFQRQTEKTTENGLSWPRIIGIAFVIALHAVALMMLLIPAVAPKAGVEKERAIMVTLIDAPLPPPPPPPPPPKRDIPPPPVRNLAPPRPSPVPPPEPPVVDLDEPRPVDIVVPPAPPAPPQPPSDIQATVDVTSKAMNPPRYPPAAARAGIQGEVVLIIDIDAYGNVTEVSVEKSSRNRDLDRAAIDAARRWKFNPAVVNGLPAAGRVRVPVNFVLN